MAVLNKSFSTEQRAEQIKACCETIIENAEKIAEKYDLTSSYQITINISANEIPKITASQEFYSRKVIDLL